ncbi:circadian clock KaiB family protein [Mucilaginibacter endophyticus]|uniref:circadian clock KaiB family protein n=1 Tax=Mucilaginibacter endophyticus TaxID=2675003 RepID=UPI000E0D4F6D|nr:circadian clock KaiB family protein [Mucilaginibacter endophyticus]
MDDQHYKLCLYIAGDTRKSANAINNLTKYCQEHLSGAYSIEVIDLLNHPHLAEGEQIFATPTLIKKLPEPIKVMVGDLSKENQFLVGLNLIPLPKD